MFIMARPEISHLTGNPAGICTLNVDGLDVDALKRGGIDACNHR